MKHYKNSATYLLVIYVMSLGLAALLNSYYPSQAESFVEFFLPLDVDISKQPFIRYRMTLWLIATLVFISLVPVIGHHGVPEMNLEKFQRIHWGHLVVLFVAIPAGWIFYPLMALCTTCWTSNDIFYFCLTVSFFVAMQIFAYAVILKIKLILKGE